MTSTAGLHYTLGAVHAAESNVVRTLNDIATRHRDEAEAYHVARDLLIWSTRHLTVLAEAAAERGLDLESGPPRGGRAHDGAALAARDGAKPTPSVALLEDMRALYLAAAEASTAWEMLAQYAQAARDSDVFTLVSACHPDTLRQMRWANTMLKTLSPQALTSM